MACKPSSTSCTGNFDLISKKVGMEYSCLELIDYVSHVALPPSYFGKIKQAISSVLTNVLLHYSQNLNGLPLAFNSKKVKLLSRLGRIISDQSYVHFDVETELVIFKPNIGDLIQGKVHRLKNKGQLSCLIHDYIYAFVLYPDKRLNPHVGDSILFEVTKLEHDGMGVLSITGKLESIVESTFTEEEPRDTQAVAELDSGIDDDLLSKSISTNGRTPPCETDEEESVQIFEQASNALDIDEKGEKKKKKAKKEKRRETSSETNNELLLQSANPDLKKKKKHKKEKKKNHSEAENQDLASPKKKKKSKKEKKLKKELESNSSNQTTTGIISIKNEITEQTCFGSPNKSLKITDVRTLKREPDSVDLTGTQTLTSSAAKASFSPTEMKESTGGFVSVNSHQPDADMSSLRSWLNSQNSSEPTDEHVTELLTFQKKGTKRKRSNSRTSSIVEIDEIIENFPSTKLPTLSQLDDVIFSKSETIVVDDDDLTISDPTLPKSKRAKLQKSVPKSKFNLSSDSLSDIFAVDEITGSDFEIPTLAKFEKVVKKAKTSEEKGSISKPISLKSSMNSLASNLAISNSVELKDSKKAKSNDKKTDGSSKIKKKKISYLLHPEDSDKSKKISETKNDSSTVLTEQDQALPKLSEKEEKRRKKEEKRASKAKKKEQKQQRKLERDKRRKEREQRRNEKNERRKQREQKKLLKEEKRLKKEMKKST